MSSVLKNILVPTDFSACAQAAETYGIQLAKHCDAKIHFLHLAVDHSGEAHVPGKVVEANAKEVRQARANLYQLVRQAETAGVRAQPELVLGSGVEHIENYIKPFQINLLVMGSHGATGIRETIIGSKTQHVIRNSKIPSLVVKELPARTIPKNIVFTSTFTPEALYALNQVIEFTQLWDASLHLLFVNSIDHPVKDDEIHDRMVKQMGAYPGVPFTQNIADTNDAEFGISQFASRIDADMIAVSQQHHGLLDRLLHPAIAEKLVNHSKLPILVVNAEKS